MAIDVEEVTIYLNVEKGQITFDAEGNEEGRWHSRVAHVPPGSGVTIGRGYDVMQKTPEQIRADFNKAGIPTELAEVFVKFIGLSGATAEAAILEAGYPEISLAQQKTLFEIAYSAAEEDVKRICNKPKTIAIYGKTDWQNLDSRIKEVLVDLRYRGDYTGKFRQKIQKHVVNNDLLAFKAVVLDPTAYDSDVPPQRLAARATILNKPLEKADQVTTKRHQQIEHVQDPVTEQKVPDEQPLTAMERSALEGFQLAQDLLSEQAVLFGVPGPKVFTTAELQQQARALIAESTATLDLATEMSRKWQQRRGFT